MTRRYEGRGSARERGYTHRWDVARGAYLKRHPLCVRCEADGRVEPATVVNHKVPHRGDMKLFWERSNWEAVCKHHHDSDIQAEEKRGYASTLGEDGWPTDPRHPANTGEVR